MSYTVEVTREGDAWIARILGLPGAHTYARNLEALDRYVREVIVLAADLEDDQEFAFDLNYVYEGAPEIVLAAAALGARRKAREAEARSMVADTAARAVELAEAGYSVRDIGHLLSITKGRVSQIVPDRRMSA